MEIEALSWDREEMIDNINYNNDNKKTEEINSAISGIHYLQLWLVNDQFIVDNSKEKMLKVWREGK